MGHNDYPKTRQQTLHLLDNHSKTTTPQATPSEASSFAQQSGRGSGGKERGTGGRQKTFDKKKFKDHKCKKCGGKGHPDWACPKDTDDDGKSQASQTPSLKQIKKIVSKSVSQAFTELHTTPEADSDISASDDGDDGADGATVQSFPGFLGLSISSSRDHLRSTNCQDYSSKPPDPPSSALHLHSTSKRSFYWTASPRWICFAIVLM